MLRGFPDPAAWGELRNSPLFILYLQRSVDMSAWIELHQSLPSHRKTLRLQSLLKLRTPQAVGHLCLL